MTERYKRAVGGLEIVVGMGTLYRRVFLPNEPNRKIRNNLGMNRLGKKLVGFVLQKRGEKK